MGDYELVRSALSTIVRFLIFGSLDPGPIGGLDSVMLGKLRSLNEQVAV